MKGHKDDIPDFGFPVDHNVALLGHELGNVLNGLLGMAELLGDSGLNAEQFRWLKAIEHSSRQMQSLIQTVRFFESESGLSIVPRYNRTDGVELLEQVVISHTPAASSRNNQLLLVLDPDLPKHWFCDSCLVRQLLDNLVGNAIKFTSAGKIVIEVAAAHGSGTASEMLELRISDTGPGLGTAAGKWIFDAYQRSCPSTGDQSGDRGLGLFICRNIVLAMNGKISCSSPKSGGARFTVALPEALIFNETYSPVLNSSLLAQIRCQLKLGEPLRRSVMNFLTRLGVSCSNHEPATAHTSGHGIVLLISDAAGMKENPLPGLLLTPQSRPGLALGSRILAAPVLESSLGLLLLEMALQWRSLAIRNGIPGSAPEQR
jgi:hypothetical protein